MERVLGVALQARVLGAEVAQLVRELQRSESSRQHELNAQIPTCEGTAGHTRGAGRDAWGTYHLHGPVRVAQERCADDRIVGWQGEVGAPDGGDRIPQRLRVRRAAVRMLCVSSM